MLKVSKRGSELRMSARPEKRKVEFIESYWTGGELGSDYQWNDNHGALVRCRDCWKRDFDNCPLNEFSLFHPDDDWFCADGERR